MSAETAILNIFLFLNNKFSLCAHGKDYVNTKILPKKLKEKLSKNKKKFPIAISRDHRQPNESLAMIVNTTGSEKDNHVFLT